jgi:membrane protein YqaA with SNARE-associated domain
LCSWDEFDPYCFEDMGAPIDLLTQIATPGAHASPVPHWLAHLGALGLFAVAAADSSVVPLLLPGSTDLLLLWLVVRGGDPWILVVSAIGGSLLGGYTTWQVGRKGGESALRRYISARMLGRITRWVKRHPVLAVLLPALLPPPIPLSPFVLASGALGVSRNRFLTIYGVARCLRYALLAWLGVFYGRTVAGLYPAALQRWSTPLLWIFGGLMAGCICFGIWKVRGLRRVDAAKKIAHRASAARVE